MGSIDIEGVKVSETKKETRGILSKTVEAFSQPRPLDQTDRGERMGRHVRPENSQEL